jgi:hypothetical protein
MTYLAYAGIGSRETPTNVQNVMRHLGAYLYSQQWTLRSGGANGADKAFEEGVDRQMFANPNRTNHTNHASRANRDDKSLSDYKEIYLPWIGFNNSASELHPRNIPFTEEEILFASRMHPAWERCSPTARLMHQRNVRQIMGTEFHQARSQFVICWTPNGALTGGTAQALRMAAALDIPVINLGKAKNETELTELMLQVDTLQNQITRQLQVA